MSVLVPSRQIPWYFLLAWGAFSIGRHDSASSNQLYCTNWLGWHRGDKTAEATKRELINLPTTSLILSPAARHGKCPLISCHAGSFPSVLKISDILMYAYDLSPIHFFFKWNNNNIYKRLTLIILPCHTNWSWSQHDTAAHVAFNVSHRRLVAVFRFPDLNLWPACCSPLYKRSLTHIFILNNQQHVISLRNPFKKQKYFPFWHKQVKRRNVK